MLDVHGFARIPGYRDAPGVCCRRGRGRAGASVIFKSDCGFQVPIDALLNVWGRRAEGDLLVFPSH